MVAFYLKMSHFFVNRKAFNVLRLAHVYVTVGAVYIYRLYSYYFSDDYSLKLNHVKETLYDFYRNESYFKN